MTRLQEARVLQIFTCPDKGLPMVAHESIKAIEGMGLEGDRYSTGKGFYSDKRPVIRHVTLVGLEAIEAAYAELETPFVASETRRNIITEGVDLNNLVDVHFSVGEVAMLGVELCTPCTRPSKLTGIPDFRTAFEERGGLRAEVLNSGLISVGSRIIAG